jgi:hypothetical protein
VRTEEKIEGFMMTNLTNRQQMQNGTTAATTTMWQPCLGLLVVGLSDRPSSLSLYTFGGGNQQGRAESITGLAIKDRQYLKS